MAGVTLALVPFADRGASVALYVQLGLGMLLFQFAIGAVNDIADAEDDAARGRDKPIPRGLISRRTASMVAVMCLAGGLIVTSTLDLGVWFIGIAGLACGLVYDTALKRTRLSWVPLSLAIPLVPAWVFLAADAWEPLLWTAFPAGMLIGSAIHFANELPDIEPGRPAGGAAHLAGAHRS